MKCNSFDKMNTYIHNKINIIDNADLKNLK